MCPAPNLSTDESQIWKSRVPPCRCKCDRKQRTLKQGDLNNNLTRPLFGMRLKRLATLLIVSLSLFALKSYSQSNSYADKECLLCHGQPEISQITSGGKVRSLFVDPEKWNQDIHHIGHLLCVDCHTQANPYLHFREGSIKVDCARCHPEEAEEYLKNVHLTFSSPSPGKELPLCFHCHTKHHVLPHDDPASSVHEKNIGETCSNCHAEVMVQRIFGGGSLGKISGHRKGDISERFDMRICISCHYQDSAHGTKRVYKAFCSRCHDVRTMANFVMGPTHLSSIRSSPLNDWASALVLTIVLGVCAYLGYRSRKSVANRIKSWLEDMRIEDKTPEKDTGAVKKEGPEPQTLPEKDSETKKEEIKHEQEAPEEKKEEAEKEDPRLKEATPKEEETKVTDKVQEEEQGKEQVDEKKDSSVSEHTPKEDDQTPHPEKEDQTHKQTEEPENNANEGERETE